MTKPLLSAVLVVKDEASWIEGAMRSVRPHVDRWTLYDTGSTDGTPELARGVMAGIPGQVRTGPFPDYAAAFNAGIAADAAPEFGEPAEFRIRLAGHEVLEGGDVLRAFLLAREDARAKARPGRRPPDAGSYHVEMALHGLTYRLPRVARHGAGWAYVGATHEALVGPEGLWPEPAPAGVRIVHVRPTDPARDAARWARDAEVLAAVLARDPTDARATYYLAQSLRLLGRHAEAREVYLRRTRMGGFREEIFWSFLHAARCGCLAGLPWAESRTHVETAAWVSPHRAEPLYELATHARLHGDPVAAERYAAKAATMPLPDRDVMVVERGVYGPDGLAARELAVARGAMTVDSAACDAHAYAPAAQPAAAASSSSG